MKPNTEMLMFVVLAMRNILVGVDLNVPIAIMEFANPLALVLAKKDGKVLLVAQVSKPIKLLSND